MVTVYVPWE